MNGVNSSTCVDQSIADSVYRLGHYEYSYIYRDDPRSLAASIASYGVWVAELADNIRAFIEGKSSVIYRHNIAHDGSMSRLLSILQVDMMVWPGMGSEIVFEIYEKGNFTAVPTQISTVVTPACDKDNCLRQFIENSTDASAFCPTYIAATSAGPLPTFASDCGDSIARVSSACSCIVKPTPSIVASIDSPNATSIEIGYFVRVLWMGKVLKSSNPSLGVIDMLPLETLLAYFDGLVGKNASLMKKNCGV